MQEIYKTNKINDCKTYRNLPRSHIIIKILFFIKNY